VCFHEALTDGFKTYAAQIITNAKALAAHLAEGGYRIVSGGTDTHLILVDVGLKDITGKDAEAWLNAAGIVVNKNTIPFDGRSPFVTSGVRIGTPSVTSRGLTEEHMAKVGDWILRALDSDGDEGTLAEIAGQVRELSKAFPIYDWRM